MPKVSAQEMRDTQQQQIQQEIDRLSEGIERLHDERMLLWAARAHWMRELEQLKAES